MSILMQDLKLSVRQLWQRPVFTLTAVLTLAIGMGVNAVAFTVINGVLFKGPAINAGDDVGRIETTPGGGGSLDCACRLARPLAISCSMCWAAARRFCYRAL
jgi:hypothetical protein